MSSHPSILKSFRMIKLKYKPKTTEKVFFCALKGPDKARLVGHRRAASGAAAAVEPTADCAQSAQPCRACIPEALAVSPSYRQPRVVIVGAGIAGLSAAERLITCGIREVTVLEALARPGGRINTVTVEGLPIDLGSAWIYGGCPGNAVYTLACEMKALKLSRSKDIGRTSVCFDPHGNALKSTVYFAVRRFFYDILNNATKFGLQGKGEMDTWTFFDNSIKSVLKYFPEGDRKGAEAAMYGMTNDVKVMCGTELTEIPISKFGLIKKIPGGNVAVEGGMSKVLTPLLDAIKPPAKINFGQPVRNIFWDPNDPTGIRAFVSTCDNKAYPADYVIITLPLGVLKCVAEEMFIPALPPAKLEAIRNIGLGHLSTICMRYVKPWWVPGEGSFRLCWPPEVIKKPEHWTNSIGAVQEVQGLKDTLRIVVAGKAAVEVERVPDCQLLQEVTMVLRRFLQDPSLPTPVSLSRSKWVEEPQFRGTASFLGWCANGPELEVLAGPLAPPSGTSPAPVLLFAGEATAPGLQATTHGARLTGVREADRILSLTNCFAGPPPPQQKDVCGV